MTATIKGRNRMARHIQPRKKQQDQLRQLCTQSRDTLRELTGLVGSKSLDEQIMDEAASKEHFLTMLYGKPPSPPTFSCLSLGLAEAMTDWAVRDSFDEEQAYFGSTSGKPVSSKAKRSRGKRRRRSRDISIEQLMGMIPITQSRRLIC